MSHKSLADPIPSSKHHPDISNTTQTNKITRQSSLITLNTLSVQPQKQMTTTVGHVQSLLELEVHINTENSLYTCV